MQVIFLVKKKKKKNLESNMTSTCAVAWRIFVKSSFISSTDCSKIFSGSSKELTIAFAYDYTQDNSTKL